jgi:hypothetical protein
MRTDKETRVVTQAPRTTVSRRYEIRGEVARGGTAIVYHAYEPALDRDQPREEYPALAARKRRVHAPSADLGDQRAA